MKVISSTSYFFVFTLLPFVFTLNWQDGSPNTRWSMGCDFFGNDLTNVKSNGESCAQKCSENPSCTHFTWTNFEGGTCWLKQGPVNEGNAKEKNDDGAVCGYLKGRDGGSGGNGGSDKLWGIAYNPWRTQSTCDISQQQINDDLRQIAELATTVRIYGFDCDFGAQVLKATKQHGLQLVLGLWIDASDSKYREQKSKLEALLKSGPDFGHVIAVNVGNEALARREQSEDALIGKIKEVRDMMRRYGFQTPVTTVDVFDKYSNNLASNVDIVIANLHSFFANQGVDGSPNIVFDLVKRLKALPGSNGKRVIVGETGWPSGGSDHRATQDNEWKYLKNFHCRANRENLAYFYFEAFDADWKNLGDSNIESHWGVGTADRKLKNGLADAMSNVSVYEVNVILDGSDDERMMPVNRMWKTVRCATSGDCMSTQSENCIKIINKCQEAIYVGTFGKQSKPEGGGFKLEPNGERNLKVEPNWEGRIWGRTGCFEKNGRCSTGDCGGQKAQCEGRTGEPPATLAEIKFRGHGNQDYYDVSNVDGYNLPMSFKPIPGTTRGNPGGYQCTEANCLNNAILNECPENLAVKDNSGRVVGCKSECTVHHNPEYCCTPPFNSPNTCKASDYARKVKAKCPLAYSYAYDDQKSTFTCRGNSAPSPAYMITFCG